MNGTGATIGGDFRNLCQQSLADGQFVHQVMVVPSRGPVCTPPHRLPNGDGDLIRKIPRGWTVTSWFGPQSELTPEEILPFDEPVRAPRRWAPTLVLGFGNVLLGDDGAGVHVVERLRAQLGPDAATIIDAGTLSFSLLSLIEATGSMLVIDAAELKRPPGAIQLYEGGAMDAYLKSGRRRTVHEVGLIDLLDMARLQDCLPDDRALLCIQPYRIDWSETLSEPVAAALPEACGQAAALLRRWNA